MKKQPNPIGALFSASVLWLTATISGAQSWTWLGIEGYGMGVSADGSVVVGSVSINWGGDRAFRWTAQSGIQDLGTLGRPESGALGVSGDGSVVVGWAGNSAGLQRAFRWTALGGMQELGLDSPSSVSADGSVVVGSATGAAFRWTAQSGMENLNTIYGDLLRGSFLEQASGISPDGRYIVGRGYNAAAWRRDVFLLDTGTSMATPLRFTEIAPLADGRFRLSVTGAPGANIEILVSTNLQAWGALTNLPNPTGSLQFTDAPAPQTVRFYRARYP